MAQICRMCKGHQLAKFLDLGFTPPADSFLRREQLVEPETWYPLQVYLCEDCGLSQLGYVVSPEILYRHDYPYEASITRTGHAHWAEFADSVSERFGYPKGSLVVDIGSNVGVLLGEFARNGYSVLGIDPASNIVRIAERRGIETLDELFSPEVARQVRQSKARAHVITATNVFAHIDDLDQLMAGIDDLLDSNGVFIVEAPNFANLLAACEYDTIYHEHLSYLSVAPMRRFFARFDLDLFDVVERDIHGGSMRVFVGRKGVHHIEDAVEAAVVREQEAGIRDTRRLARFAAEVERNRAALTALLHEIRADGSRVAGIGAPAKGMTLLNYCRIGPETLDFITEKSTLKIGRFTPGMHIPVASDDELLAKKPDYGLLLAWNFAEEIMANLKAYRQGGGRFIVPIPNPRILE